MPPSTASPASPVLRSRRTYHLDGLIGRGGNGDVYRAWFEQPDGTRSRVAIKCLQTRYAGNPHLRARFAQEAVLTYKVSAGHPHLVPLRDHCFADPGSPFLVLDFVDGPSLFAIRHELRGKHALIRLIAADVLSALEHIHESGLVHRDVSPANVLIGAGGIVKLTDLGLARPIAAPPTWSGLGVPLYAAPEVLRYQPHTAASDLYSLGAVLHELVAGHPGRDGPNLPSGTPDDLDTLIRGLLHDEPERRLSIAEAFALLPAAPMGAEQLAALVATWQRERSASSSRVSVWARPQSPAAVQPPRPVRRAASRQRLPWIVLALLAFSVAWLYIARTAPQDTWFHLDRPEARP